MSTPRSVLIAAFTIPYLICCLVHLPNTRIIRLGLLPLGLASAAYLTATIHTSNGCKSQHALTHESLPCAVFSLLIVHYAVSPASYQSTRAEDVKLLSADIQLQLWSTLGYRY
jgi:hypothetical protein